MPRKDPEAARAYASAWYSAHKEESRAYQALYRSANREKERTRKAIYRASHKDEIRAINAVYYATNREEVLAQTAEYRAANKDKAKAYRTAHLPEYAARASARRAVIAGTMVGLTVAQRTEINRIYRRSAKDKNIRCYLCGKLIPLGDRHVDHILPLAKGGRHRPSNLAVACRECNQSKNAQHPNKLGILI